MQQIYLSVVIPVYNEEASLPLMESRLFPVLDKLSRPYEVIFINDGSKDRSQEILEQMHARRPKQVRVIQFLRNYGQHPAIMAGFQQVQGEVIVTLDCDLQNPPEDIPNLLATIDAGHDTVGGIRAYRQDSAWRRLVSKFANGLRGRITSIHMKDQGCMMRAYTRGIIDQIVEAGEATPFISALSHYLAANPTEIPIGHEERAAGTSKYGMYKLIRINFDLVTGFSVVPLQVFTLVGMGLAGLSFLLVVYMAARRIFMGPEVDGVFTLFAIMFFLISVAITGLGLIGEYVGRIYMEIRKRPRFVIKQILEADTANKREAA